MRNQLQLLVNPFSATMDDLDREWKPNGRPQSTIARNFMSELDDLFKIDGGLDEVHATVHEKKQAVTSHTQQLEEIEARLRETEERLRQAKSSPPPARKDSQRRAPINTAFSHDGQADPNTQTSPTTGRRRQDENQSQTQGLPIGRPRNPEDQNQEKP